MAVSVTDLLKPIDKTSVLTDLYLLARLLGLTTTAFQPGEPVPVILDVVVGWAVDQVWNPIILPALQAQFFDYATGNWLSLLAWTARNRPRITALAGTGTVTLENRGSYFGTQAPGQLRIKNTVSGKTYSNSVGITFTAWIGSGDYPTFTGTFEADEVGTASNAQPGDIAVYPTPLVSGPIDVFAQAPTPLILGSDEESDPQLVARAKLAPAEDSIMGPRAAYVSVALDPVGAFTRRNLTPPATWGTAAPAITRVRVYEPGSGAVVVYLASSSGPAGGDASTPDTDVFKANLAIQSFVVPPGVASCTVQAASSHTVALGTIILYVDADANVTQAGAIATATGALDAFFATLQIGGARTTPGGTGYVFERKIEAVVSAGPGVAETLFTFADTPLGVGDVAVPTYTIVANLVSQN